MKISYDILQKFVTPPQKFTARELADTLTMHTVEVEDAVDWSERLKGAVVGLVTAVKPHPQADKLKLATVDIGKKSLEVVCGGVNLKTGMKVAFAQVGTLVRWHGQGDWTPLEKAVIRGVESEGMICAAEELGISDDQAIEHGIMDISELKDPPGTPLAQALGLSDIILEIDNKSITHRPDLWGHLGLARELAAIWQIPFVGIKTASIQSQREISLSVRVDEPELCRRYLAVVVSGINISESPRWLKTKLQSLGMRPINNIVDATNYVMLELGQPLHAFDFDQLAGREIIVRTAGRDEKIITLDGVERKLARGMLVIADKKQAQAIAGVIGGVASEVSASTQTIVLESATFDPINIRQTASSLGVRTEASSRFEKGLDPNMAEAALRRVIEVILQLCPQAKVFSQVVDIYPQPLAPVSLNLSLPWLYKRLGIEISLSEVMSILERLGFIVAVKRDIFEVKVPAWRATRDITTPEDLVEEVARIYGYDRIKPTLPKFDITPPAKDEAQVLRWKIRDLLVGAGWTETLSYSFVGRESGGELELINPVDKNKNILRPTLLSSIAEHFISARKAGYESVKMFELGRVFQNKDGPWSAAAGSRSRLPHQPWHLAMVIYEKSGHNFRKLKGMIELIEQKLGVVFKPVYRDLLDGWAVEIDLDGLTPNYIYQFKPLPKYPSIERDISMIMPANSVWGEIESALKKLSPLIEAVQVFDVYEEMGSVAFRIVFRDQNRTLKSKEVDEIMKDIIKLLQNKFNVIIR